MVNENVFPEENAIKNIFTKYEYFQKSNRSCPSSNEIKKVIINILEIMNLPNFLSSYPEDVYNQYILDELANVLWNSASSALRHYLMNQEIYQTTHTDSKNSRWLKGRILGLEGNYPNIELEKDNNIYSFRNGIPILITDDNRNNDDYSEVSFLNESELRFSSSIILAPQYPGCNFYFDNYFVTRIDNRGFQKLSNQNIVNLMFELLYTKIRKSDRPTFFSGQDIATKSFRFQRFDDNIVDFNRIYDNINTNDQLTMRTLFYLVKSSMLWANMCFGEDAISNVLFSIEGALLLLQRKEGHSDRNIDIEFLDKIFANTFNSGEELFEFIQEGYEKRISIVHAYPRDGVKWTPFLMADDFYEYFDISRMLLVYIILDKIIEDD